MTKYVKNTPNRGRPFPAGNPGRPKGARNRATIAAESLLENEGLALTRKCIELAMAGDSTALRLSIERLIPVRRDRRVRMSPPESLHPAHILEFVAQIVSATADGELSPSEARDLLEITKTAAELVSLEEMEHRLALLEGNRAD